MTTKETVNQMTFELTSIWTTHNSWELRKTELIRMYVSMHSYGVGTYFTLHYSYKILSTPQCESLSKLGVFSTYCEQVFQHLSIQPIMHTTHWAPFSGITSFRESMSLRENHYLHKWKSYLALSRANIVVSILWRLGSPQSSLSYH